MTTYAFPTFTRAVPYTDWKFGMEPNSRVFTSPLSGQSQSVDLPGARWALNLRLAGLSSAERGMVEAFMAKLRGRANRFTCHDLINPTPRGTMRGTMVLGSPVSAGAVSVQVFDSTFSSSGKTLLAGDKLTIAGELKVVTADATANGSSVATVTIEPPMRAAASGGASIVWDKPTAQFMLVENSWRLNYTAPRFADLSLDAIEVFS